MPAAAKKKEKKGGGGGESSAPPRGRLVFDRRIQGKDVEGRQWRFPGHSIPLPDAGCVALCDSWNKRIQVVRVTTDDDEEFSVVATLDLLRDPPFSSMVGCEEPTGICALGDRIFVTTSGFGRAQHGVLEVHWGASNPRRGAPSSSGGGAKNDDRKMKKEDVSSSKGASPLMLWPVSFYGGAVGVGARSFAFPWGIAVHAASGCLLVCDSGNNRVVQLKPGAKKGDAFTWIGSHGQYGDDDDDDDDGGGGGGYNSPRGIACDDGGLVFVADTGNGRIVCRQWRPKSGSKSGSFEFIGVVVGPRMGVSFNGVLDGMFQASGTMRSQNSSRSSTPNGTRGDGGSGGDKKPSSFVAQRRCSLSGGCFEAVHHPKKCLALGVPWGVRIATVAGDPAPPAPQPLPPLPPPPIEEAAKTQEATQEDEATQTNEGSEEAGEVPPEARAPWYNVLTVTDTLQHSVHSFFVEVSEEVVDEEVRQPNRHRNRRRRHNPQRGGRGLGSAAGGAAGGKLGLVTFDDDDDDDCGDLHSSEGTTQIPSRMVRVKRLRVKASALQLGSIGAGGRGGRRGRGKGAFDAPTGSAVLKLAPGKAGSDAADDNERVAVVDCFNHSLVLLKWDDTLEEAQGDD